MRKLIFIEIDSLAVLQFIVVGFPRRMTWIHCSKAGDVVQRK